MSRFNVYVLVNIKLCVGCDNLSVPKRSHRRLYKTVQNTQIFKACIPVAGYPSSVTQHILFLPEEIYGQPRKGYSLEYF